MKTSIQLCLTFFLILSVLSCSETVKMDNGGRVNEPALEEDEKIGQMMSVDYRGEDAELAFSNAVKFFIRSENNPNAGNEKISIALLENDRFFNTDSDIVFDFSMMNNPFIVDLEYTLPTGLDEEDIVLLLYSPETSIDEFDHHEVMFSYNTEDGKLTASFSVPDSNPFIGKSGNREHSYKSGSSKYTRLNLNWSLRKELLTEGARRKIIKMPFYEQSYNTCWAASVKMMGRAYSSSVNREMELRLHEVVKNMNHSDFNGGAGLYAFRYTLPRYLRKKSNIHFETSSFLRTSALQYEIVKKINKNKPVILNLRFPGIGGHQVVVVGYEIDMVSAAKGTFKLLYHNPQNADVPGAGKQSMYTWADFDWLMKDKWPQELYQILYADRPIPDDTPLQTLATPILDRPFSEGGTSVGRSELAIISQRKSELTGEFTDVPIYKVFNRNMDDGYMWMQRAIGNDIEMDIIPDSVSSIKLVQTVYNADDQSENLTLFIEAYDLNEGERLYSEREIQGFTSGTHNISTRIPMNNFFDPEEEREITVFVQLLKDDHLFLDGYRFKFILEPRAIYFMDFRLGNIETTSTDTRWNEADGKRTITDVRDSHTRFAGELDFMEGSYSGSNITHDSKPRHEKNEKYAASVRFDNNNNPAIIEHLETSWELSSRDESSRDETNYQTGKVESHWVLKNIGIREDDYDSDGIYIQRRGLEVCDYIQILTSTYENKQFIKGKLDSSREIILIDYRCKANSELEISLKSNKE